MPKGYDAKRCGNIGYKEWNRQRAMGISQPHARNCSIASRSTVASTELDSSAPDAKMPPGMNAEEQLNYKLTHAKQQQSGVKTKLKQALVKQAEFASELEAKKTLLDSSKNATALNNVCYNGKGAGTTLPPHSPMNPTDEVVVARGVKHNTLGGDVEALEELQRMIIVEALPFARTIRDAEALKVNIVDYEMRVSNLTRDIHSMEDQLVAMRRRHEEIAEKKQKREREDNEEATNAYSNTGDDQQQGKFSRTPTASTSSSTAASSPVPPSAALGSPYAAPMATMGFGEEDDSDIDDDIAI